MGLKYGDLSNMIFWKRSITMRVRGLCAQEPSRAIQL